MAVKHKKKFGIYHWDTFDNETLLIDEANTLEKAEKKVEEKYKGRISAQGADKVEIVDKKGTVLKSYGVT